MENVMSSLTKGNTCTLCVSFCTLHINKGSGITMCKMLTHTCACTGTYTRTHTRIHAHTHTHTHACAHAHTHTHACAHAHTHTHTHTHMHARMHTHACTHIRTHTHTLTEAGIVQTDRGEVLLNPFPARYVTPLLRCLHERVSQRDSANQKH